MGKVATIADLGGIFTNIVQDLVGFAGIALFIMLLVGGFRYITAGGDPKAVDAAQKTITYAVVGLVLIIASYLILVLIKLITGVDVTTFKVTLP